MSFHTSVYIYPPPQGFASCVPNPFQDVYPYVSDGDGMNDCNSAAVSYECTPCQKHFATKEAYERHMTQHVWCTVAGCTFTCRKDKAWKMHLHVTSSHGRCNASDPTDVTSYIRNRRSRFPTAERIQCRVEEQHLRLARGDVVQTEQRQWLRACGLLQPVQKSGSQPGVYPSSALGDTTKTGGVPNLLQGIATRTTNLEQPTYSSTVDSDSLAFEIETKVCDEAVGRCDYSEKTESYRSHVDTKVSACSNQFMKNTKRQREDALEYSEKQPHCFKPSETEVLSLVSHDLNSATVSPYAPQARPIRSGGNPLSYRTRQGSLQAETTGPPPGADEYDVPCTTLEQTEIAGTSIPASEHESRHFSTTKEEMVPEHVTLLRRVAAIRQTKRRRGRGKCDRTRKGDGKPGQEVDHSHSERSRVKETSLRGNRGHICSTQPMQDTHPTPSLFERLTVNQRLDDLSLLLQAFRFMTTTRFLEDADSYLREMYP